MLNLHVLHPMQLAWPLTSPLRQTGCPMPYIVSVYFGLLRACHFAKITSWTILKEILLVGRSEDYPLHMQQAATLYDYMRYLCECCYFHLHKNKCSRSRVKQTKKIIHALFSSPLTSSVTAIFREVLHWWCVPVGVGWTLYWQYSPCYDPSRALRS